MNGHFQRLSALTAILLFFAPLAVPGPIVAEPVGSLISQNAVTRLPDGRVALILPQARGHQLYVSKDTRPITLNDFTGPARLFGEEGLLAKEKADSIGIGATGKTVHLVSTYKTRLDWYTASDPAAPVPGWQRHTKELDGAVLIQDVIYGEPACVVYREAIGQPERWRLGLATLQPDGAIQTLPLAESRAMLESGHGTWNSGNILELVWVESELTPEVYSARLDLEKGEVTDPRPITQGTNPDILHLGQRTFIASEQLDGSMRVEWRERGNLVGTQELHGRAAYNPRLVADENGVVWLFAAGAEQRGLYFHRFLGSGFGDEAECANAPGEWNESLGFAVQPFVDKSSDGFAIVNAEYFGTEYQYRFQNIQVPRFSVTDERHVLFLDLLEVAELDHLEQRVRAAVRSEANPINLNGSLGTHDAAWAAYATVLHDDDKFRMWYNSNTANFKREYNICYAESEDGIRWTKPELGLAEFNGSAKNNLLFPMSYGVSCPFIMKDTRDSDPSRRYKMVFESKHEGATDVFLSWSGDGIHWQWPPHRLWGKSAGRNKAVKGFHPWHEPLSSFFCDPLAWHPDYRWKVYGQDGYAGYPNPGPVRRNLSVVNGSTPYDFVGYEGNPVLDARNGYQEDQVHGGLVQPYEGLYVCLYQHWWDKDWLVDLRLAVSRDGLHFVRVQPQSAVLSLGAPASWDSGMLCTPNSFFTYDDKIWIYYRGSVGTLATGRVLNDAKASPGLQENEAWRMMTGLARLRVDGFASLTVESMKQFSQPLRYTETPKYYMPTFGRIATIPIDATGIGSRTLHINLENYAPGFAWLKAQLRDADTAQVIPGFSFMDCDRVDESAVDRTISWKGSSDLSKVQSKRIRVEFQLFGALDSPQLYSFWFSSGGK